MRHRLAIGPLILLLAGCGAKSDVPSDARGGTERGVTDGPRDGATPGDHFGVDRPPWVPDTRPGGDKGLDKGLLDKLATPDGPAFCGKVRCDCMAKSNDDGKYKKLWGNAKEVTALADFKVRVDTFGFGTLKVTQKPTFPTKCGEWKTAVGLSDFTYQVVTVAEDFTISYDQFFPGFKTGCCK